LRSLRYPRRRSQPKSRQNCLTTVRLIYSISFLYSSLLASCLVPLLPHLLKCRENRARLRRTSTFLPGPPYVSRENVIEDHFLVHEHPSMEQVSLFAASTPSKFTVHGSRYVPQRMLGWEAFDTTQPLPVYTQPAYNQTIIPSNDGETFTVVTHEDPFTLPSLNGVQESTTNQPIVLSPRYASHRRYLTPRPRTTQIFTIPKNLPKWFRRSILRRKSPYRAVPSLDKEDTVLVPQVNKTSTERVRRVSSLKATTETAGASRRQQAPLSGRWPSR
jgi:hypothetical protein